jgi:glycosyltransferase involved in cell wall biosynthesis
MVARGHDVTLFATADSITSGRLEAVVPRGYSEDPSLDARVWESLHVAHCMEMADGFDLVHAHQDWLPLLWTHFVGTPVLITIHGFSSPGILPAYHRYSASAHFVSISDADRDPELPYVATVHNGIRLADFAFNPRGGDDLVFLGRIHPEKGVHLAIALARRCGRRLNLAGIVHDEGYWKEQIEPAIDGEQVVWHGQAGPELRNRLLGEAYASCNLVTGPERFGLTMVESMACGTPVLGIDLGSVREVVAHGRTGFVVDTLEQALEAVPKVAGLERAACRAWVEERFGEGHMVDAYERVYATVLEHATAP